MDIAGILLLIYLGLMLFGNDDVRGAMLGLMVLSSIEDNQLLSPFATSMGVAARALPENAENLAIEAFEAYRGGLLAGFETVDFMLTPVTPMMPFAHDQLTPQ